MSTPASTSGLRLAPELQDRLRRMAEAKGLTVEQVLADAVGVAWVRFACEQRLRPEAW